MKYKSFGVPRYRGISQGQGSKKIFRSFQKWNREKRDMVIYDAHVTYGYTLKEIADYLGIHYNAVSKAKEGYTTSRIEDKKRYFKT